MKLMNVLKLVASIGVSFAAGGIGSIVTVANIPTWYVTLDKPWFNPPNWVFGPVWSILYLLMGIALYLVWTTPSKQNKKWPFVFFGTQLVMNSLWSLVFFGMHQAWAAVLFIVLLWLSIMLTMQEFDRFSRRAVWLLVPYIAWVTFAGVLNIAIAAMN